MGRIPVRPGVIHLLEHVATARNRAQEETWARLDAHTMDLSGPPSDAGSGRVGRRLTPQASQRREQQRRYPIPLTVLA